MIEESLVSRLNAITTNLYPGEAPLDYGTPCATYTQIGADFLRDLDGEIDGAFIDIQINVFDPSPKLARDTAKASAATSSRGPMTWCNSRSASMKKR